MDCAKEIENGISKLEGIEYAHFDYFSSTLSIEGNFSPEKINQHINKLGYKVGKKDTYQSSEANHFSIWGFIQYLLNQTETRLGLIGAICLSGSFLFQYLGFNEWIIFAIQIIGLVIAGLPLARSGISNLIINHEFNINLLMTAAATGAMILGEHEESISLVLLFSLAEALEGYTTERAREVLSEITHLSPDQAIRLDGKKEELIPIDQLKQGDILMIKPGENIPMDGIVSNGTSEVNQAPITGESIPVVKQVNDRLFAGTINGSGVLELRVTGSAADNTIVRIITMITESQNARSRRERLIDRFAKKYTPSIFIFAILVVVIPTLLFNQPLFNGTDGSRGWLYRGLSLLVIGCPCAMILSTPMAAISGIVRGVRQGILFKGGVFIEGLAKIKVFAFDKTGTLTRGEPSVAFTRSVKCTSSDPCEYCDDVLAMAGSIERRSNHPIAKAVVNEAKVRGLLDLYPPAENVTNSVGQGIAGKINGKHTIIASHKHFDEHIIHSDEICAAVSEAETCGYTTMMLSHESQVAGYITLSDQPRSESEDVISRINLMKRKTVMLTGDNPQTAQSIGQQLKIGQIFSSLLPEDKVSTIVNLKKQYGPVAMVGDGINDAPALAAADIGIAVGGVSSAQTIETADIILMANSLNQLPFSIQLSGYVQKIIKQNLSLSLGIKAIFLILAMIGFAPLWLAVLADSGMAVVVVLNSLRPLGFRG